ncbi:MAG: transglutaminase domain-containing protein [Deltaproteobacteria bacterium]|nr:transglutaminase domain-containing protein [Deltaproteobacteria bacterium]
MTTQRLIFIQFISIFILAAGCRALTDNVGLETAVDKTDKPSPATRMENVKAPEMSPLTCAGRDAAHGWNHRVYRIEQDGLDVGREVRTTFPSHGPMGEEEITISHAVTRHRSHDVEIDRFTVQTERFLKENGTFLRGCFIQIDESNVNLSLVGFNGAGWERVSEVLDTVESGITKPAAPLKLKGDELVGHQLNGWLSKIAMSGTSAKKPEPRYWYVPKFDAPVLLDMSLPQEDSVLLGSENVDGAWVTATRAGTERVVLNAFVGKDGATYLEEYPALHQVRTRTPDGLSVPTEYTDPYRGLFSNAYLGFPDAATDATYHIVSGQPISLETFAFIAEPENQNIKQIDANTLELKVKAGGPDGDNPPTDADLSSTKYINTNTKLIRDALQYLKSGGRRGKLPVHRCDNAVPIIAKSVRIRKPNQFWADADKAARLVAEYVHAILPVKRHTHTMKNAVDTLKEGLGDCTEHSVLFASLMRAAKVPTRLVSGMYLTHGGVWVFHMWNEYWDGDRWKSIDVAVGPNTAPGANYVALSLGAANFQEHRHNISFFLDRAYSGLEFNLVAAGSHGEALHLAVPRKKELLGSDAVIVQAITLSNRGDFQRAFDVVSQNYDPKIATIDLELLRAELLYRVNRLDEALREVVRLRRKTSLPANVFMLDKLQFDIHIAEKNTVEGELLLDNIANTLGDDSSLYLQLKAELLTSRGQIEAALQTLENGLLTDEYETSLMAAYLRIAGFGGAGLSDALREKSIARAWNALYLTHYASADVLKAAASLFFHLGQTHTALPIIEHALIMKPDDADLRQWHNAVLKNCG